MTATVVIQEGNGSTVSWSNITSGRYCTMDSASPGDNNPCVVPSSGLNYSYWKHHRLYFSGSFSKINNIRWYTSGSVATNWALGTTDTTPGMLMVGLLTSATLGNGCPAASYQQSAGTAGTTGYALTDSTNGHAYYKDQTASPGNADSYTSSTPLSVDLNDYTTSSVAYTYAVVTQVRISSSATQGDKASETFTFRYDEI
jgi:hypothetical protein